MIGPQHARDVGNGLAVRPTLWCMHADRCACQNSGVLPSGDRQSSKGPALVMEGHLVVDWFVGPAFPSEHSAQRFDRLVGARQARRADELTKNLAAE